MPSSSDDDDEDSCARGMALAALKRFLGFSIEHCRREGQKQRSLLTWETVGGSDAWESRRRRGLGSAVDGLRPCRQVAGGTLGELSAVDVVSRVYIRNNLNPKFRARVRRGALIRVFDVLLLREALGGSVQSEVWGAETKDRRTVSEITSCKSCG